MSALRSFVLLLVVNYVLTIPLGLKPVCVWGGGGRTSHMSHVYLVLFMAEVVCEDPLYTLAKWHSTVCPKLAMT